MVGRTISRGSIWWVDLPGYQDSSVQKGLRPVIVVSSPSGCRSSSVISVCPITSHTKNFSVNIPIKQIIEGRNSQVLTNQIVTLPREVFEEYICRVDLEDMVRVEEGIALSLGLFLRGGLNSNSKSTTITDTEQDKVSNTSIELKKLIDEAKDLRDSLTQLVGKLRSENNQSAINRRYIKRSSEEIAEFISEWENPCNNRNEVAEVFNFNSYKAAYNFWATHKNKALR